MQLDGSGRCRVEEQAIAQAFFHQQFTEFAQQSDVPDAIIQRQLFAVLQSKFSQSDQQDLAALCLRCFISHCIEQQCIQLEAQFGAKYGFTRSDLFPFVLDDTSRNSWQMLTTSQYQPLASKILHTFDPDLAQLSTWVGRQIKQHPELSQFLREHGVYLIGEWAILNDTRSEQLQRILTGFYALSPVEVEQAFNLLQAYHAVYRQDRLEQRQLGKLKSKAACLPPTSDQLSRMAQWLRDRTNSSLSNQSILNKLQSLATQLRCYRLQVRGGASGLTTSIDQPDARELVAEIATDDSATESDQIAFLTFYRDQFSTQLDQAIEQATNDRVTYLQRKKNQAVGQFLTALHLFHCQGQAMGEIALEIGLEKQFQVTRLLKLKEFRADVRQRLLKELLYSVLDKAKAYADPMHLHQLDRQVEAALSEQIDAVIQQAEAEAAVAKCRPLNSLFSHRLCHHLDTRRVLS